MNVWRKKVSVSRCASHRPSLPLFPTFTLFPPRKNFCGNIFSRTVKKREISLSFEFSLDKPREELSLLSMSFHLWLPEGAYNHHHHIQIIWLTTEETKIDSRHAQTPRKFILRNRYLVYLKLPRRPINTTLFGWWRHHTWPDVKINENSTHFIICHQSQKNKVDLHPKWDNPQPSPVQDPC